MTFRTYLGYLSAICAWTDALYPHAAGTLAGVADAVKARRWRGTIPTGRRTLSPRARQFLRNGWATEIMLVSPRVIGDPSMMAFANHWATVQAYYAVFEAFQALVLAMGLAKPPKTHAALLHWASEQVAHPASPFVVPWTMRALGASGTWSYDGYGAAAPMAISNLAPPTVANAPHLVGLALRTTRSRQIDEKKDDWRKGLPLTAAGKPRKTFPTAILATRATAMRPTTLVDLLYRLRLRANYREADAFLSGTVSAADAVEFHASLTAVVGMTLLTTEIYLAHIVGKPALEACAATLKIPASLEPYSMRARITLW
jgi:hypothetical protein